LKVRIEPVRFRVDEASEGLRVVMPSKWSLYTFLAIPVELSLFGYGAHLLFKSWISTVFARGSLGPKLFLTGFAAIWFAILGRVFFPWFWNLGGRHILVCNDSEITLRRELFGFGRTKVFSTREVSHWRYAPEQARGKQQTLPRGFAFDFAGKEIRVGTAMDEAEVKQLFAQIRRRFPNAPWAPLANRAPDQNAKLHTH
jgi:hypothetical protein